jgi:carbonic anhydrase
MEKLGEGVHSFQKIGFPQQQELFSRLSEGQHPEACFIACADSRIDPNLMTNATPGQLFILRNAGNIVPCYGTGNNSELGVKDVIVCGHTDCGAIKGILNPDKIGHMPTLKDWLRHADSAAEIVKDHYSHLSCDALTTVAAEESVLVQREHLRTLPVVASRLSRGRLRLHGWMYKFETGEVYVYDSESGQFEPMRTGSK